ncbi:MAG: glycosyltransferase [Chloroflexi bacterium]|nr:glycosyltransferase [Chloroflexota bacterium]
MDAESPKLQSLISKFNFMRILYLSQLVPYPADAGPKVRIYHVLQYLAHAGHEVTLAAFCRENDTLEQIDHMRQYCTAVYTVLMRRSRLKDMWFLGTSLLRRRPFLIERDKAAEMNQLIARLLREQTFDAVHADQLWMAQYALAAKTAAPQINTVLDQHNAMYLIPQRLADSGSNPVQKALLSIESGNMSRYEVDVCRQFDQVVWVTAEDKAAVAQVANQNGETIRGPVIPICVDPETKQVIPPTAKPCRVTFLGGLHWPPNADGILWFAEEVWPLIQKKLPDALFTVIGKDPPAKLTTMPLTGLDVTGYVDDPRPYLAETAAFIVPLHAGGGMRVKIVDGWSWGLPIVSTTIGAEGIQYEDGRDILIADNTKTFAEAVTKLFRQPELANSLRKSGRSALEAHYDWRAQYTAWDDIYTDS